MTKQNKMSRGGASPTRNAAPAAATATASITDTGPGSVLDSPFPALALPATIAQYYLSLAHYLIFDGSF